MGDSIIMGNKKRLSSLLDYMKITGDDDDEYENDDLFDDDDDDDDEDKFSKIKKPSFLSKSKKSEDTEYEDEEEFKKPLIKPQRNNKIVSIKNDSRGMKVYVIKPQEFNEAQIVTDFLKDGKTIVINMEGIEVSIAQRIVDFIGGASYALGGSLQAVSANIFIAAPDTTEVTGDLREEILNESILSPDLGKN